MEWVIKDLPTDGITLDLIGLNQTPTAGTLRLRPVANQIELFVFHSPENQLPDGLPKHPLPMHGRPPVKCDTADHFSAFYPLVNESEDKPVPVYEADDTCQDQAQPDGGDTGGAHAHPQGRKNLEESYVGLDFMCIMATAPAEPNP
jgi:hypothetical protein